MAARSLGEHEGECRRSSAALVVLPLGCPAPWAITRSTGSWVRQQRHHLRPAVDKGSFSVDTMATIGESWPELAEAGRRLVGRVTDVGARRFEHRCHGASF